MVCLFVLDKVCILFVDWVICQVHEFVVFIKLRSVGFWSKSSKTFFENIDAQWLVASDQDVNSKVKLVTVDQQRIGNVATDDAEIVNIQIIDVV